MMNDETLKAAVKAQKTAIYHNLVQIAIFGSFILFSHNTYTMAVSGFLVGTNLLGITVAILAIRKAQRVLSSPFRYLAYVQSAFGDSK